jgi:leader peptidase (prepilin peptidase)/N-methyltransferase
MDLTAVVAFCVFGAAGVVVGAGTRRLLDSLRRGARLRGPACAVAMGGLWGSTGGLWGTGSLPSPWLPALLGLGWLGVAAGAVDLCEHRLPDALTLPAAGFAPLALLPLGWAAVARGLLGSVVAVIGYGVVHLIRPPALGAGDVKLAAALGAVLGAASWGALAVAAGLAALLTGAAALLVVCRGGMARAGPVAHGPSMLAAAWLVTVAVATGRA